MTAATSSDWLLLGRRYVQEADLEFFKDRVERDTPAPGCGNWELVMAKDFGGGVRYTAWKRHLAVRPALDHLALALPMLMTAGQVRATQELKVLPALQDGKTDYKSVTVAEDATAQEFMDFYLDDDARARWVSAHLASGGRILGHS